MKWADVKGAEDLYAVSDEGEVFSKTTKRIMKQFKNNSGYLCLHIKGKAKTVHRIVAEAFVPIPKTDEKLEVNHINYDKTDNRAVNLEWLTHAENCAHSESRRRTLLKKRTPRTSTGERNVQILPSGRFRAHYTKQGKNVYIGVYDTIEEAAEARDKAEAEFVEGKP